MREGAVPMSRKITMAARLKAGTDSAGSLANRYNLSRRTVFKYANQLTCQRAMKEDKGRPRIFDQPSIEALRQFFEQPNLPAWDDIKAQLVEQQRKSWCRLHHAPLEAINDEKGPKKMSPRTIRRYLKMFNYQQPLRAELQLVWSMTSFASDA